MKTRESEKSQISAIDFKNDKLKIEFTGGSVNDSGIIWLGIFDTIGRHDTEISVKNSTRKGDIGFFIAKNGEFAINFSSEQDKALFIKTCPDDIKEYILRSDKGQETALYFYKSLFNENHSRIGFMTSEIPNDQEQDMQAQIEVQFQSLVVKAEEEAKEENAVIGVVGEFLHDNV